MTIRRWAGAKSLQPTLFVGLLQLRVLNFIATIICNGSTITKDKASTGAAGAYYVAFRLAAMGYAVGLTTYGTRSIDLLVANLDTGKSITTQTKTMLKDAFVQSRRYGTYWKWRVGKAR